MKKIQLVRITLEDGVNNIFLVPQESTSFLDISERQETKKVQDEIIKAEEKLSELLNKPTKKAKSKTGQETSGFTRKANPFNILGAYPKPVISLPYEAGFEKNRYNKVNYGFFNDDTYCEKVDYFNLQNPENMFKEMNFFSDYSLNGKIDYLILNFSRFPQVLLELMLFPSLEKTQ